MTTLTRLWCVGAPSNSWITAATCKCGEHAEGEIIPHISMLFKMAKSSLIKFGQFGNKGNLGGLREQALLLQQLSQKVRLS